MDSTLQELSRDTKNRKIGVRTKKLCKFQNLKKISKHCNTFSRRGYCIFPFFRYHMSSYCIKSYMDRFYTSRAFQRYQEHLNRSSYEKVMTLRSWSKNRKAAATSRRENQRRDVAESCTNDVATLPNDVATLLHDVATFGVGFGLIFSPF